MAVDVDDAVVGRGSAVVNKKRGKKPQVRSLFPETWLWELDIVR